MNILDIADRAVAVGTARINPEAVGGSGEPGAATKPVRRPTPAAAASRSVFHVVLSDGRLGVSMPLHGKRGREARVQVDEADLNRLRALYGDRWTLKESKPGYLYVETMKGVRIARVIAGAEKGETVVFRDGDPCNLARGNLAVMARRDALAAALGR